jgi:4-hydroxy-tetrahydrodipicolinate synthase
MHVSWSGVFPAVTTQFHEDLTLNLEATAQHLEVLIQSGVSGLVMLGSLGENVTLTTQEKQDVLKTAIEVSNGRVPVLSGVAELSTAAAVSNSYRSKEVFKVSPIPPAPTSPRTALSRKLMSRR